jgi:hypothetical protein
MRASLGCLIVVVAMIGGGYLAAQILGCFFANRTGEWDPMTVVLWIVIHPSCRDLLRVDCDTSDP